LKKRNTHFEIDKIFNSFKDNLEKEGRRHVSYATHASLNWLVHAVVRILSSEVWCSVDWHKFTLKIEAACSFETLVHF